MDGSGASARERPAGGVAGGDGRVDAEESRRSWRRARARSCHRTRTCSGSLVADGGWSIPGEPAASATSDRRRMNWRITRRRSASRRRRQRRRCRHRQPTPWDLAGADLGPPGPAPARPARAASDRPPPRARPSRSRGTAPPSRSRQLWPRRRWRGRRGVRGVRERPPGASGRHARRCSLRPTATDPAPIRGSCPRGTSGPSPPRRAHVHRRSFSPLGRA